MVCFLGSFLQASFHNIHVSMSYAKKYRVEAMIASYPKRNRYCMTIYNMHGEDIFMGVVLMILQKLSSKQDKKKLIVNHTLCQHELYGKA